MPLILASCENLSFLKKSVRTQLPQIKSSHLTESLACALGFRTHAALLALTGGQVAPALQVDLVRMAQRLQAFGYAPSELECVTQIVRSPSLPEPIVAAYRNGDRIANDRWFYECRRRNIPMVYIEMRRKFARLRWDCISIDPRFESHVQDRAGDELVYVMFALFQRLASGAPGNPLFEGKSFVGYIDRLLPELACELAEAFFGMLYMPMHAQARAS